MDHFRKVALGLPSATEQDHFGGASFRINGKIFAQLSTDGATGLVKLKPETQDWVVSTFPEYGSVEPHWGRHGWTRLALSGLSPDLVADLVVQSWQAVAPKTLHGLL